MKYLFAIIGLLLLAVIASAQEMKTTGRPPVRTTDKHAVPPRVAVVVPVRSSGNAKRAAVAVSLPVRKAGGGGSGTTRGVAAAGTGTGALTRGTTGAVAAGTGAAGTGQGKGAAAGKGAAVTLPSMLSAKQAADLRTQNAGGSVTPAAPGAH